MKYRDVCNLLQKLRSFLLGRGERRHDLHNRFAPLMSPRTVPPPDIPRGPEYKYSNQYYYERSLFNSVRPPVVAPVAEGPPPNYDMTKKPYAGGIKPDLVCFTGMPTPGPPWWWDGHCFYELPPCPPSDLDLIQCPPPEQKQEYFPPPVPQSPDQMPKH